ncbi:calcium homeostasis modulator protein 5 [Xenopus laevis]|uniref:Calcium homeostasis modulator protein 5 n=2 Tax=Xenopus laevis TaxID=8355 RepID=A0A974HJE3_XENLA|nr:calcium homeostasis modulator protein 5 [Xenopus laevis]OCT80327.1 hypothetical protein XELAEV_18027148mg [Xenopus laevis]
MDTIQNVLKFFTDNKSAFGYGFMTLMTIGGQQLFSLVAFKCPCSHLNFIYGSAFLLGPAVLFFIIGYFLNSRTWKLFTGCCVNPKQLLPRRNPCYCLRIFIQITLNALILPVMWISVALLNGTFYTCAMSGWQDQENGHFLCNNKSKHCFDEIFKLSCDKASIPPAESEEILALLNAQSQVLGWCLILISASISLLSTCYFNCRSKVSSLQMKFWRIYIEKEKVKFDELALEYATKLAERNLRSFFENKEPDPFEMPSIQAWKEVSSLYSFNKEHHYYSTVHRFVEHGISDKGQEMIDFVDGHSTV